MSELKQLHSLVDEIEEQNGMPVEWNAAIKKFFDDLRDRYYEFCNLNKTVNQLRSDIEKLNWAQDSLYTANSSLYL